MKVHERWEKRPEEKKRETYKKRNATTKIRAHVYCKWPMANGQVYLSGLGTLTVEVENKTKRTKRNRMKGARFLPWNRVKCHCIMV